MPMSYAVWPSLARSGRRQEAWCGGHGDSFMRVLGARRWWLRGASPSESDDEARKREQEKDSTLVRAADGYRQESYCSD